MSELDEAALSSFGFDESQLEIARALEPRSYVTVPLAARDEVFGSITLVTAESGRRLGADDLVLAQELAPPRRGGDRQRAPVRRRRSGVAAPRGRSRRSATASSSSTADGVIRLWNAAATTITGVAEQDALGRPDR